MKRFFLAIVLAFFALFPLAYGQAKQSELTESQLSGASLKPSSGGILRLKDHVSSTKKRQRIVISRGEVCRDDGAKGCAKIK